MPSSGMGRVVERCDRLLMALATFFFGEIGRAIHLNSVHGMLFWGRNAKAPMGGDGPSRRNFCCLVLGRTKQNEPTKCDSQQQITFSQHDVASILLRDGNVQAYRG